MMDAVLTQPIEFGTRALDTLEAAIVSDWRDQLPVITGNGVTVRELRTSDAASLFAMLTTEEVTRFVSPPPTTVDGFVRFIAWSTRERAAGRSFTLGIVPDGYEHAVGLIQLRALEADWTTAEWGFALGSPFWGRGIFHAAACAALDLAFDTIGAHRIEARAVAVNGRGNGALRRLGACHEARLRQSFSKGGVSMDQFLWSIVSADWRSRRAG